MALSPESLGKFQDYENSLRRFSGAIRTRRRYLNTVLWIIHNLQPPIWSHRDDGTMLNSGKELSGLELVSTASSKPAYAED
ncbi:hypothetical protein Tco_0486757 [Tanacetum coccineum]